MTLLLSRRRALVGSLLAVPALATAANAASHSSVGSSITHSLSELERRHAGRICVAILDVANGKRIEHRADERMLLCSTFKAIAAAHVLARVDRGEETLDRKVIFSASDVVQNSPVTQLRTGNPGMTMAELCQAAITRSDNTAGNLLLESFGGPAALTAYFRTLGDQVSRLDRRETELNYHDGPDDIRDTTTAAAMMVNLHNLLFATVLSPASRSQLAAWLITNKTGDSRLRAGIPADWLVGDKTGVNEDKVGNLNDIAVLWPPNRTPIIVAAYCEIPTISATDRNAVMAEIGRIASRL